MDNIEKFELIKIKLKYNPKVCNVKKLVDKCVYGRKYCYYFYSSVRSSYEKCPFKNQIYCHRYLSDRCCEWQLVFNKRFRKSVKE